MAALSTSRCSSSTSGNSSAWTRVTTSRHSREVSSTLALSTLVTLAPAAGGLERRRGRSARSRSPCSTQRRRGAVSRARSSRRSRSRRSARAPRAGPCPRSARAAAGWRRTAPGSGRTGRRFAYSPRPLRRPEQALLGPGRVGVRRVPLRAADGGEQDGVGRAAGRRAPRRSAPSRGRRSRRRRRGAPRARSRRAREQVDARRPMISGPIPSPGRVTMRWATRAGLFRRAGPLRRARVERGSRRPAPVERRVDEPVASHGRA